MDGLLAVLHPDVVFTSDGGGIVIAARKPLEGADRVARAIKAMAAKAGAYANAELVDVNGLPGVRNTGNDGVVTIVSFTVDGGRITAIDVQRNPEKLRRVQ
jgi:RNA polymerase sigma-70 factor, ECF subfamily